MASSALGSQSIALLQFPSGTLIDFAGTVEPSGWLMCDGRAVSRTTYAALFASISTAFGSGNGSTTFNLPDFRGRFARYNDNMGTAQGAASRDTGRVHGTDQTDAMQGHRHNVNAPGSPTGGTINFFSAAGTAGSGAAGASIGTATTLQTDGSNGTPRTAVETRPINLACNKLIKI